MILKVRKAAILLVLAAFSACGPIENHAPRVNDVKTETTRFETRLFLLPDRCPTDPDPESEGPRAAIAPLVAAGVAAVLPIVADLATNALGNYLKAREDALTGSHHAQASAQLYGDKGKAAIACLVVARGSFGASAPSAIGTQRHGSLRPEVPPKLKLVDFPDFYFQARITLPSDDADSGVMTLTPDLLHLAKTAAGRTSHDTKTINMVFVMAQGPIDPKSIAKPAAAADPKTPADAKQADKGGAGAIVPLQFEKVKIGTEIQASLMDGRAIKIQVAGPGKSRTNVAPFNMLVTVEETEKPSAFEELLVTTYTSKQKDLSGQIVSILKEALGIK
ncbi:MAG: hypothetical protein NTV97_29265 [Alphaproteobacteria bacterium]|nr:hypothetical protein [Alphaproteobacteria bacterium]